MPNTNQNQPSVSNPKSGGFSGGPHQGALDPRHLTVDPGCPEVIPRVGKPQFDQPRVITQEYKRKVRKFCPFYTPGSICLNGITCPYIHDYKGVYNEEMQMDYLIGMVSNLSLQVETLQATTTTLFKGIDTILKHLNQPSILIAQEPLRSRSRFRVEHAIRGKCPTRSNSEQSLIIPEKKSDKKRERGKSNVRESRKLTIN